ncbi:MAG: cytochrome c maturation protein CcmE [Bacteroidota bacterium]
MKKIHLIAVAVIAISIALLMSLSGEMSTYSTFREAMAAGGKVKIAGILSKDKEMIYDPIKDANSFSFYITDSEGEERRVRLLQAKPQDFELSEQIVLTGEMHNDEFIATDVLLKCPSKYKDEEIYLKNKQNEI